MGVTCSTLIHLIHFMGDKAIRRRGRRRWPISKKRTRRIKSADLPRPTLAVLPSSKKLGTSITNEVRICRTSFTASQSRVSPRHDRRERSDGFHTERGRYDTGARKKKGVRSMPREKDPMRLKATDMLSLRGVWGQVCIHTAHQEAEGKRGDQGPNQVQFHLSPYLAGEQQIIDSQWQCDDCSGGGGWSFPNCPESRCRAVFGSQQQRKGRGRHSRPRIAPTHRAPSLYSGLFYRPQLRFPHLRPGQTAVET